MVVSRVLSVVQLCLLVLPFLVYSTSLSLVLVWCVDKGFSNTCYTFIGISGGLTLLSFAALIESIVNLISIKKSRTKNQKYVIRHQIFILISSVILALINLASAGLTEEVNFLTIFDDVVWVFSAAGVYQLILIILCIKIIIDLRKASLNIDYHPLLNLDEQEKK